LLIIINIKVVAGLGTRGGFRSSHPLKKA